VLLTVKEYEEITNKRTNILELLAMPEVADIEFEFPRLDGKVFHPADFS
jgi:hypothetical protein